MKEYVSFGAKLRAYQVPAVTSIMATGLGTVAGAVHGIFQAPLVVFTCIVGLVAAISAIARTVTAVEDGWEAILPPPRKKACAKCRALAHDNQELRHALATLRLPGDAP